MRRFAVFLITLTLIAGMVGCLADPVHDPDPDPDPEPDPAIRYELRVSATSGGSVTSPGEGTFEYDAGKVVFLQAVPDECYTFVNWTGDTVANPASAVTTVTMDAAKSITANFALSRYTLRVYSRDGGVVISPSEEESEHDCGTVVNLVAEAEEGYQFTYWSGSVGGVDDVNAASTNVIMMGDYSITANFVKEIRTWYDLDAIREDLRGSYVLMNDLDSTKPGYGELASPTANDGKGWQPIGGVAGDPVCTELVAPVQPFTGSLDGQGYEIIELFTNRPEEDGVGLIGCIADGGVVKNTLVTNVDVTGRVYVGALVGLNLGTVSKSCSTGTVSGSEAVGGVAGWNYGVVRESHSSSSVIGDWAVGGLIGLNHDTLHNSYATGSVTGNSEVGGLVGGNAWGRISDSYSSGSVVGKFSTGGLVGRNWGSSVSNSHYNHDEVSVNGQSVITIGALFDKDFEQWLANGKSLEVDERLSRQHGYHLIQSVSDFRELLAFGQDDSLRFRLTTDLDLSDYPGLYIPYLAGEFDGNGHKISNLSFRSDCVSSVGLIGHLAPGGELTGVAVENVDIVAAGHVGGLVGLSDGSVSNCYSGGSVTGSSTVGGLVGGIHTGTLSNSYFSGSVSGGCAVGGVVGWNTMGGVSSSYYNYNEVLINGKRVITIGAMFKDDFEQWLASDRFLDINERLTQEDGWYLIGSVGDFKQLLTFGQDGSLRFRLTTDLDLATEAGLYIPYLAGKFDGNGHKISNLTLDLDFAAQVGLIGFVATGGELTRVAVQNAQVTGCSTVGGVVGYSQGLVSDSYFMGSVTGRWSVGGLVGFNAWGGTVRECYSGGGVTGHHIVGGLVGRNDGAVHRSFSASNVVCPFNAGGLVGYNRGSSTVSNSFWDTETSSQGTSDGGTGKTTAEMKSIATFSGTGWNIIAVGADQRNTAYTWNIVDGQTYPFLSWQPVS